MSGVPLNTPVPEPISTKLAHVGIVVPARVIACPSASVAVTMYAYAASSGAVVSTVLVNVGPSFTPVIVIVTVCAVPSALANDNESVNVAPAARACTAELELSKLYVHVPEVIE